MKKITLNNVVVEGCVVRFHYSISEKLKEYFNSNVMFLEYEKDMTSVPLSIITIPFVSCMMGITWLSDAKLFIDEIDETFYNSLKQLKVAYSELHKTHLNGLIIPSRIIKNRIKKSDNFILLFGGGIDCHCSYLRNKDHITDIVNIFGWSNKEQENNNISIADKKYTEFFAKGFGLNSHHVSSNFASQFNLKSIDKSLCRKISTSYWYGFLHSMAFLSISTLLSWTNGISNLMIASSFTKDRYGVSCGSYITTDSEFKFATNGATLHDGFELNRQDKVKFIVNYQRRIKKPYIIQACSFNDHNCCECEKCFRTIIELVAENADPKQFGFNIKGSITKHWQNIISRDIGLWGVDKEKYYYTFARKRMRENHDIIQDKEFVDWFINFDFLKAKKEGLRRYYRQNFFSILRRKLHL